MKSDSICREYCKVYMSSRERYCSQRHLMKHEKPKKTIASIQTSPNSTLRLVRNRERASRRTEADGGVLKGGSLGNTHRSTGQF